MRIDTEARAIYLEQGMLLTVDELRKIIAIFDMIEETVKDDNIPLKVPDPSTVVIAKHLTRSDSNATKLYEVTRYKDGHYSCECTDFVIRRSKNGTECKHISRLRYGFY